eukprot:TRINITY_DN6207_c0_g1_i1.p1 TRINITY_DN6207_c0_g1~~TRINITY_DN6207_c0_g1_i1.p1  ORF type:complete len:312 (+),score=62.69 TRINITY_DN6207_c0_g1_i1:420-1355(+)
MASRKDQKTNLISSHEIAFIREALSKDLRIDGRNLLDFRTIKLSFGDYPGKVQVQLGRTSVHTSMRSEMTAPNPIRPTEGFFRFHVEFSPQASPAFEIRRGYTSSQTELIRVVERGLRESRAIDTEALCIIAGEKVWSVRLDINILDDEGNLQDCCSIAAIVALHHFKRPSVSIVKDEVIVHKITEKDPVALSIHHMPISITFGTFSVGGKAVLLVDPAWKEELIMDGKITFTLNPQKELCAVQKAGGLPLSPKDILLAARIAQTKVQEISKQIYKALQDNESGSSVKLHFATHYDHLPGTLTVDSTQVGK